MSQIAIVLGASSWPNSDSLAGPESLRNSATAFVDYLHSPEGLYLRQEEVLSLFDSEDAPSKLIEQIISFLQGHKPRGGTTSLIMYYVGHGFFVHNDYYLAIKHTNAEFSAASSLHVRDLADAILKNTFSLRRFVILDCCFAAAAYKEFQSAPLQAAVQKLQSEMPPEGTALLCASGARDFGRAPKGEVYTMFSGALLRVLKFGNMAAGPELSLADVGDLTAALINDKYPDTAVRPEVHSPEKRKGDVALIPLFPNQAVRPDVSSRLRAIEQQLSSLDLGIREVQRKLDALALPEGPKRLEDKSKPVFTVLELRKTLRFTSRDGQSIACLERNQRMRANTLATEFWICAIASAGSISKLQVEGDYTPTLEEHREAGMIDVAAKYPVAIPSGQVVNLKLEYTLKESFMKKNEYLGHLVQHETETAIIEVAFKSRKCLSAVVYRKYAGLTYKMETDVERNDSGSLIRIKLNDLKLGEEYRLAWKW